MSRLANTYELVVFHTSMPFLFCRIFIRTDVCVREERCCKGDHYYECCQVHLSNRCLSSVTSDNRYDKSRLTHKVLFTSSHKQDCCSAGLHTCNGVLVNSVYETYSS